MNTSGKVFLEAPSSEVYELDQAEFPHPWSREQWLELDLSQTRLFTYREDGKLLAFALLGVSPFDETAHLYKILLRTDRRGSGIIEVFWSAILENLRSLGKTSVYLEVQSSNQRAIKFYEKSRFSLLRRNRAYYSNGEDALIMSLTL